MTKKKKKKKQLLSVMVNFVCQLDWDLSSQIQCYFWVCLWGCFQTQLAFETVGEYRSLPSPMQSGVIQSTEGLHRTKKQKNSSFCPTAWKHTAVSPNCPRILLSGLCSHCFWFSEIQIWTGTHTTGFLGSGALHDSTMKWKMIHMPRSGQL